MQDYGDMHTDVVDFSPLTPAPPEPVQDALFDTLTVLLSSEEQ